MRINIIPFNFVGLEETVTSSLKHWQHKVCPWQRFICDMLQRLRHYIVDICSLIFVHLCLFVIFVIYVRYICSLILVMYNSNTAVPIQGHHNLPCFVRANRSCLGYTVRNSACDWSMCSNGLITGLLTETVWQKQFLFAQTKHGKL